MKCAARRCARADDGGREAYEDARIIIVAVRVCMFVAGLSALD